MKKPKRTSKRQIRERRRAKAKRREMYANDVVGLDFASVEKRVLATMEQNQGFKTGEDLYGGHPIGSPERNAAKAQHYMELYGVRSRGMSASTITGRSLKKT